MESDSLWREIGVTSFASGSAGIGGFLKQECEDFVVEEVLPDGRVLEVGLDEPGSVEPDKFVHFTLEKVNWDTHRAIKELARSLRISQGRFSFAGTKDRRAVTTQRMSGWNVSPDELKSVSIKDIAVRSVGYAPRRVGLGDLWGNRFTITVMDVPLEESEALSRIARVREELNGVFPNFYGVQRFGDVRPITHVVGRHILKGDFEGAVLTYLTAVFPQENEDAVTARRRLAAEGDYREALKYWPKRLGYEAILLNHLVEKPGDFSGALLRFPRTLSEMFVHAYQSYVFNRALSEVVLRGEKVEKLPLVGRRTAPDEVSAAVIAEDGIRTQDFYVKDCPQLGSRGAWRRCFAEVRDFDVLKVTGSNPLSVSVRFMLPKGCYATVFLREVMSGKKPQ
ncbi:putative tRNA pseudouridine synthase D [uncultured archaeon]|nr:putative tRNA pseudouridine synthase D [uncultured archaeon]